MIKIHITIIETAEGVGLRLDCEPGLCTKAEKEMARLAAESVRLIGADNPDMEDRELADMPAEFQNLNAAGQPQRSDVSGRN